jgi:hypothetical protein
MTEPAKVRTRGAQRKMRAHERRDNMMADFCAKAAKAAARSDLPSDRRDAQYWKQLEAYYRATEEFTPPERRQVPSTRRLEFLMRAGEHVAERQAEEVARLRSEGVSWADIGQVASLSRQGAVKRWSAAADALAELIVQGDVEDGLDLG